jgi:GT2 family glycosyltransferase
MTVAVAVVSWNTVGLLRECLRSLRADAEAGTAEVWVVDNASDDGSAHMVESEFPWANLIVSEENLGFGRAVNEVAARTQAHWIAPANADVELETGALGRLVEAGNAHPEAAILAPRLVGTDGRPQQSVHAFPGVGLAAALAIGLPLLSRRLGDRLCIEGAWDPEREREIDWAHGAFLLCRRPAFDEIGAFDADQWMYAEDLDLAWRARGAGWAVRYVPSARVRHAGAAATTKAFGEDVPGRFMDATFKWMTARRGPLITRAYAAVNVLGAFIRWAAFVPLAALRPARYASRRDAARSWVALHLRGLSSDSGRALSR